MTRFAGVKGFHNGRFNCGLLFGFSPLVCVQAPPKVRKLFLGKTLEECQALSEQHSFEFTIYKTMPNPKRPYDQGD